MGLSWAYSPSPASNEAVAEAAFDASLALQGSPAHLDTASIYFSPGMKHNEELIAQAIKKHGRNSFIIADKIGITGASLQSKQTPDDLVAQLDESLKRLNTTYIDLLYLNRPSPSINIQDTMRVFKKFVDQGKVKYVGLIEATAEDIIKSNEVCPLSAIQMEYSLQSRDIEESVIPAARQLGIGIVAYSPLGRGMLSGSVPSRESLGAKDYRKMTPRFSEANFQANLQAAKKLAQIAGRLNITPAQLALAWVHNKGKDIVPIPGSTKVERIKENIEAASITLSKDVMDEIEREVPQAVGMRYPNNHGTFNARQVLQSKKQ
jgi:aryl-alcohol dehydrogenase-like predicted oxidoreductase